MIIGMDVTDDALSAMAFAGLNVVEESLGNGIDGVGA
jgi:hypothetical protein